MKISSPNSGFPAGNPFANILVIVVGVLAIGVSIVLGFFAFIIIGSIVLVMAAIVGLRVWWLKRSTHGRHRSQADPVDTTQSGAIEGEYRVVAEDDKDA